MTEGLNVGVPLGIARDFNQDDYSGFTINGTRAMPDARWTARWTLAEWSPTVYVYPDKTAPYGSVGISAEGLFDLFSSARSAPVTTYYVDFAKADNTGDGLTLATAKKDIHAAVTAANATTTSAKIFVAAGEYVRSSNFSNGNNVFPTVDIAFIATGGRSVVGAFDTFVNPTVTDAVNYPNVYAAVLANVNRIMDRKTLNRFGNYLDLALVTSVIICNQTPGSWYYDTGTNTYYIHRADGAAPTAVNTRLLRASVANSKITSPVSVFFGGALPADGFDLEGGNAGGCINYVPTVKPATNKACVVSNCSLKYAGGRAEVTATGFAVNSIHGIAALFNCRSDANWTDAYNAHNTSIVTAVSHFMTVNCTDNDNGRGTATSCNGWTTHEDVVGLDVCGINTGNRGGTYRSINTTVSWLVHPVVINDYGDILQGGSVPPTAFRTDNTAIYFIDRMVVDMPGASYILNAAAGSAIYTRNVLPRRCPDSGAGTISTY